MTGLVRIGPRTAVLLALATAGGLLMFCWPLVLDSAGGAAEPSNAPLVFMAVLPLVAGIVLASLSEGGMDAKALALLGVLSAVDAGLRPLGAGIGGIETVFFLLVLAGRVFGPGFGFALGCTSLFASALLTSGVGPWLPYQMLAAAWIGLGAGLVPARRLRGRLEIVLLVGYGVLAAYAFGFLMNLTFWPYAVGSDTSVSFVPGAGVVDNLRRFVLYSITTSALGWDTGRAITNAVAIAIFGPAVLATLRRAARRASYVTAAAGQGSAAPSPPTAAAPRAA